MNSFYYNYLINIETKIKNIKLSITDNSSLKERYITKRFVTQ
jgi:hypothetical protein